MKSIETAAHRPLEASLPLHGVSVLESHHARDFAMKSEAHPFWQLLYVFRGQGFINLENREFSLRVGAAILLGPHTFHALRDETGAPLSIYAVNFAPALVGDFAAQLSPNRPLHHPALASLLPDTLRRLLWEQTTRQSGFEPMMTGLALQLLALLGRLENPQHTAPERVSSLQTRIENYICELERSFHHAETVDQVAARLGMSRRRFTALFRQTTGNSWLPYVRRLRLKHAERLLRESNRTVLSVSFECGFEDVSVFHRAFKREFGSPPDAWRRENRT